MESTANSVTYIALLWTFHLNILLTDSTQYLLHTSTLHIISCIFLIMFQLITWYSEIQVEKYAWEMSGMNAGGSRKPFLGCLSYFELNFLIKFFP